MSNNPKCPECHSTKVWKVGLVPTRKGGKKMRFKCSQCARSFYAPKPTKKKGGK